MSKLSILRHNLNRLRQRRIAIRWSTGYSALCLAVLWAFAIAFLVDWLLEMDRPQRLVSLLLCAGAATWAFFRFTRPFLGQQEDIEEMALLVERQRQIDSDLVAALQFDSPEAAGWGSPQLETAVIEHVGSFSRGLDVFEGLSYRQLTQRIGTLAVTLLVLVAAVLASPAYASAFFDRLFLGATHYPTRTVIEEIRVNDTVVSPTGSRDSDAITAAYGRPLKFEVRVGGEIPQKGRVRLTSSQGDLRTEIELLPTSADKKAKAATFFGQLPRVVDSVSYQLFIGDAWTDPRTIRVIPLPAVTVDLKVTPPSYAVAENPEAGLVPEGTLQIAVIEGSRVDLTVRCGTKRLKSVLLTTGEKTFRLTSNSAARRWTLKGDDSPLARVTESLHYEIRVEDTDGLRLEEPIEGHIRIKADRGPRVSARVVTRYCLPTAKPRIRYGASDDYGLSRLHLLMQIVRADGTIEETTQDIATFSPATGWSKTLIDQYALDLKPLELVKGDELKVTVEAFDYRGKAEPKSNVSEPLVLKITDREGIISGLLETDQNSARQLDAIIRRELGIGESK
jgi:hypothetical protein